MTLQRVVQGVRGVTTVGGCNRGLPPVVGDAASRGGKGCLTWWGS